MSLRTRAHLRDPVALAALLLLGLLAAPADAQQPGRQGTRGPEAERLRIPPGFPLRLGLRGYPAPDTAGRPAFALPVSAPAVVTPEAEPNNSPASAQTVSLGDTVSGVVNPAGDVDVFAIDLLADSLVVFDVDAQSLIGGSYLDSYLTLYAPDSVTILATNDDWRGPDSRLFHRAAADGRYFLEVSPCCTPGGGLGGPAYVYTVSFDSLRTDETEPNGSPGEADVMHAGESFRGGIVPTSDVDYVAIDVSEAGTLRVSLDFTLASFPALLTIYDSDGTTVLDSADTSGESSRLVEAFVTTSGRYYVSVQNAQPAIPTEGADFYELSTSFLPSGPGDPTTPVASGLGYPLEVVPDWSGNLLVADYDNARVLRVDGSGTASVLAALSEFLLYGMAVDGFEDILVSGYDYALDKPGIWRIGPGGTRTWFLANTSGSVSYGALAVASDGDVWAYACAPFNCPGLVRFDPLGNLKSMHALPDEVADMAFSPVGDLHFSNGYDAVYRFEGIASRRVIQGAPYLEGMAFDGDGFLYLANGYLERIALYSPTYVLQDSALATTSLAGPIFLAFRRGTDGEMTSRLFATNGGQADSALAGTMVEVNPSGVRATGWGVGVDFLRIVNAGLSSGLVGAEYADTLTLQSPPGGTVSWDLLDGSLPSGLELNATTGVIAGIPIVEGSFDLVVRAAAGTKRGFARFALTVGEPAIAVTDAVDAVLGVDGALTMDQQRFLDMRGNNNGTYDIGDLRAYLRAQGVLTAPPEAAGSRTARSGRP